MQQSACRSPQPSALQAGNGGREGYSQRGRSPAAPSSPVEVPSAPLPAPGSQHLKEGKGEKAGPECWMHHSVLQARVSVQLWRLDNAAPGCPRPRPWNL